LGLGVAGTYGNETGTPTATDLPSFKSPAQQTIFKYSSNSKNPKRSAVADGIHTRIVPQAYYYWGSLGLLGEYADSKQEVAVKATSTEATLENTAWQVMASFVLTGEDASYKGVKPKHPFDPKAKTWGAWEIAGRYSELQVDRDAFPFFADPHVSAKEAKAWAAGLNGYLNRNLKLMLDYEETQFEGGKSGGDGNRNAEKIYFSRFQIAF
jgi:phosphate-selective porin OprO and OprP